MTKHVYVFTGAFDCGKTTTMRHLVDHFDYRMHDEAHTSVLGALGNQTLGHPPNQPFRPIEDDSHVCPMCRPRHFTSLVLERQQAIEGMARGGDLLDRGYVDALEYYERSTRRDAPLNWNTWSWNTVSNYRLVFLFEEIPAVQRARWGKTRAERVKLARHINARLAAKYRLLGHRVIDVPRDSVSARAQLIHERIQSDRTSTDVGQGERQTK